MPNIVTNKLNITNSKNFLDSVSLDSGNYLYMFLAKPNSWNQTDVPSPLDVNGTYSKIWDEMISLKRILPSSISNVVRRIDWVQDDVYAEYDHEDDALLSKPFYALNSEFNVYKCINNNYGAASKSEPKGKSLDIITLSDGYRWKYLYTISTGDQLKFLTRNWMPVSKDVLVSANAKDGAIENIKINNSGLDYSVYANVIITGDGAGAKITPKLNLGVVYDFNYTNTGFGYRFANAYISDYAGSPGKYADIRAIINPQGGHGYDPVYELGGKYLMINVRTDYNEGFGDFPAGFTFRQLGIIKNPIGSNGLKTSSATLSALTGISVSNVQGTFNQNEYVLGTTSNANAYVVSAATTSGAGNIKYIQSFGLTDNYSDFNIGENIIGSVSGATATVSSKINADILSNKGDIFYIENRSPITRSSNQTDNLHLVIEF